MTQLETTRAKLELTEAAIPAIRGTLTEAQCVEQGQHALLIRAEIPHRHRPSVADIRAEADRVRSWRRTEENAGYCRHGAWVGGSGIDYMCGACEQYGQEEEARELETYAAELAREVR